MSMEMAKVREEHGFLEKLLGTWDVTSEMSANETWIETVRSLQGIWYVAEGSGNMPDGGGPATTILTLGFSAEKNKYIGSWIGSMMDHMWVYEGDVEPDGKTLSLYTQGPKMSGEGMADYREQIVFLDDDNRVFNSSVKEADGSWRQFMEARYSRKR
jgi:hypothetical protein